MESNNNNNNNNMKCSLVHRRFKLLLVILTTYKATNVQSLLSFHPSSHVKSCSSLKTLLSSSKNNNNNEDSNIGPIAMPNMIRGISLSTVILLSGIFGIVNPTSNPLIASNAAVASAAVAPLADVGLREYLVKDGNEFLRLGLPTSQPIGEDPDTLGDVGRSAQQSVELVRLRLEQVGFAGKPAVWNQAAKDANKARSLIGTPGMLNQIPLNKEADAKALVEQGKVTLEKLLAACRSQDIKTTTVLQEEASLIIYNIRQLSMPAQTLPYTNKVPSEYSRLPQLRGRATVECVIRKNPNNKNDFFRFENGEKTKDLTLTMVIDGYHAPITSGNFLDLVNKKYYDGMTFQVEELILQTGKLSSSSKQQRAQIPLEIFYKKDSAPTYQYTSDDDLRATESFVNPFQAYGALGMEYDDYENVNSATTQFWFLKWNQALVAPSRNTLDGSHASFGYVVTNQEYLDQIGGMDVIVTMNVLQGGENLFVDGKSVL